SLVVAEEKRLARDDGATERAAELMLAEIGLVAARPVVEEVVRVERVVPQEFEAVAVELVGARLDLDVHDAAERMAELRGIGAGLQLELVQRLDAREDDDGLKPRFVVVDAVEHV